MGSWMAVGLWRKSASSSSYDKGRRDTCWHKDEDLKSSWVATSEPARASILNTRPWL